MSTAIWPRGGHRLQSAMVMTVTKLCGGLWVEELAAPTSLVHFTLQASICVGTIESSTACLMVTSHTREGVCAVGETMVGPGHHVVPSWAG